MRNEHEEAQGRRRTRVEMPFSAAVERMIRAKEDSERGPQGLKVILLSTGMVGLLHTAAEPGRIPVGYIDEALNSKMACGRVAPHATHFWQYSATGWVTCYGIQETTPIYTAVMTMYEKFVDPYADIELDQRFMEDYEYQSADEENGL